MAGIGDMRKMGRVGGHIAGDLPVTTAVAIGAGLVMLTMGLDVFHEPGAGRGRQR